ncbi:hypothetical protein ASPFODRAFT_98396, partial [Aspergillus luchuensis CBS 106.47]
ASFARMPPKASRGTKSTDVPFQISTRNHTYAQETPISTDQFSNDSADEEPSIMEEMRASLLRQLREEIAQQLRDEIKPKNEILHTRILQTIASHVRETISWEDSTLAAEIWARITSTYGLSAAEERIMTVKALLDINPQDNYPAMIRDFQRLTAKLRRMNLSFDDMIHDIFICSLGQWNQNFIRTQLDEFYSCGQGPIKNLDIATLADQLVA